MHIAKTGVVMKVADRENKRQRSSLVQYGVCEGDDLCLLSPVEG